MGVPLICWISTCLVVIHPDPSCRCIQHLLIPHVIHYNTGESVTCSSYIHVVDLEEARRQH